jgi:glycerophosphoryl diester phosphodiesterase
MTPPSSRSTPTAEWIGHRGAPREFFENTLPSFERALQRGADAVELDVHATSDGVVIVHHDPVAIDRSTASAGGVHIARVPWQQLRQIDLGAGARIPTLADVLQLVARKARVYVEIKGRHIEPLVIDVIDRSGADCAIHAFDHDAIARVSELAPHIPRGILFEDRIVDVSHVMQRTSARDVWPEWRLIDRALVTQVHAAGARVIAWTVNSALDATRLTELGVDGICSDDLRSLKRSRD